MDAYGKFQVELEHIELLHLGTLYAYDVALSNLKQRIQAGFVDPNSRIKRKLSETYKYEVVAEGAADLRRKLRNTYPQYLREILLVRAISALEVFLVDTVREVFIKRPDFFPKGKQLELSSGHLLSFHSVSEILTFLVKPCSSSRRCARPRVNWVP